MEIFISEKGTIEELKLGLKKMDADSKVQSIFILACEKNGLTPHNTDELLKDSNKPLWGGIFPSIIHNYEILDCGIIILGLYQEAVLQTIENISNNDIEFETSLGSKFDNETEIKTLAVLVDGASRRISSLIDSLFIVFGLDFNFIGGGAGSLSLNGKACVFTNDGLLKDCAIIAGIKAECGIGVKHGWESISGPFKITSSDLNVIKMIDFKPAFDVYKQIVDKHSGGELNHINFLDIAKAYPLGINKLGAEKVVRAPLSCKDTDLICVGEVPEGAFIDILHGNKLSLISAAKLASKKSSFGIPKDDIEFVMLFDCVSRALFLGNDFKNELEAIKPNNITLIGALSVGEIANSKKDYLEFYNKTAVIGTFRK